MTEDEIQKQVLQTLKDVAPDLNEASLDPEANFRDQFEFDSVDFLNFAMALEKKLGVRIPELDYPRLSSLAGCTRYLAALLAGE